ncbi:acyl-coenzyme A diphosphatase FITM2 [Misgurnus anguillicaudatus]|uniref:acyl-coenzyme A diphosphatase FITM2 n=1 Tax=Misgurnus anguillicaudatus TaxID=75329 RepID=UPI003CCF80D4
MAAIGSIVDNLADFWRRSNTRAYLACLFPIITVLGSYLKEKELVPESYFSNRRNVLNVYFVKISWGWTLGLLLPFILLSNTYKKPWTFVLKRLMSLPVATFIWYICTETFCYIEEITGSCYESDTMQVIHGNITSKAACRKAGFIWDAFDISGHSFILAYSALVIVEEMMAVSHIPSSDRNVFLNYLYIALNVIVAIWLLMFTCTSVYFHDTLDKLLGTSSGIILWYVTYVVWYPKFSLPGLPPKGSEEKKHP